MRHIWRRLAQVGRRILLGRESGLRPVPRPWFTLRITWGVGWAVLVVTQIPSLHPGLNESEFSQDPQICNLEVFPFPHFWFWVLGISGFVFLLCDYSCSRGEMGRLRQLRKDRARGTIISVSGSSLRTKDRFRPRKRRTEGTGAWALIWSYDLQQVSKVCWASVSSAV